MLNKAWKHVFFCVETLLTNGFHTLSLMNSTYPSTIWDKSSVSYAREEFCVCVSYIFIYCGLGCIEYGQDRHKTQHILIRHIGLEYRLH